MKDLHLKLIAGLLVLTGSAVLADNVLIKVLCRPVNDWSHSFDFVVLTSCASSGWHGGERRSRADC